jgi:hypothetical protein
MKHKNNCTIASVLSGLNHKCSERYPLIFRKRSYLSSKKTKDNNNSQAFNKTKKLKLVCKKLRKQPTHKVEILKLDCYLELDTTKKM